jgi:hypothetical protein
VLFLHYSGHGSNVPDKHGDEADCRDEMLCPTDLAWQDPLLDAWLRQRCDALPAGVNLTVLMAGCQSGTITRRLEPPEAPLLERYLPSPWDLMAVESRRQLRGALRGERAAMRKQANRSQDIVHAQNGPLSYRELHARTRQLVKKGKYAQVPQLEGRNEYFDLPFLGWCPSIACIKEQRRMLIAH